MQAECEDRRGLNADAAVHDREVASDKSTPWYVGRPKTEKKALGTMALISRLRKAVSAVSEGFFGKLQKATSTLDTSDLMSARLSTLMQTGLHFEGGAESQASTTLLSYFPGFLQ